MRERCPWARLTPEVWVAVRWWIDWHNLRITPYGGALEEQPAYVLQAIRCAESEYVAICNEAQKVDGQGRQSSNRN